MYESRISLETGRPIGLLKSSKEVMKARTKAAADRDM